MTVQRFIENWSVARVGERAHFQSFMCHLCEILGVEVPDKDRPGHPDYGFEKPVRLTTSRKSAALKPSSMDLYRKGCFVMEAKPCDASARALGSLMRQAKLEAEDYALALVQRPPFLIATVVGRALELWADFAPEGGAYAPFLIGGKHRVTIQDMADPQVRATLAKVWNDPWSLDPNRETASAEIATRLGILVESIASRTPSSAGELRDPVQKSAARKKACIFVSQCMFAMFLDNAGLWTGARFRRLMEDYRDQPDRFPMVAADMFESLQRGGHSAEIRQDIPRFQRDIFSERVKPAITTEDLDVLIEAAHFDWSSAGPDLFGMLLEMVQDAETRTEFGVHFTDRRLVEKVVQATVMEPLRADWSVIEARALEAIEVGDEARASRLIREFHRDLCAVKVLDPACGTGNFLYVALGLMKALEADVLLMLADVEGRRRGKPIQTWVGPGQFIGLEKDGATARIARLVMAIGQLQAHARSGQAVTSVQAWDHVDIRVQDALLSGHGSSAVERRLAPFVTPQPWPDVEFIVGNPPFMGGSTQRRVLGQAYVDALNDVREGRFRLADLATCWWDRAARILARDRTRLRRFGFILPASVTQPASRKVLTHHLTGEPAMRLVYAIADHPWSVLAQAASVRVAITVVERGAANGLGRLMSLCRTPAAQGVSVRPGQPHLRETRGDIAPDLTIGLDIARAAALKANAGLASRGVQVNGAGFVIDVETAARLFAQSVPGSASPVRPYRNGRDLTGRPRGVEVIDFSGWDEGQVRRTHPGFYAHLLATVKAERERKGRARYRRDWWQFGEARHGLRTALQGLDRYIVTVEIGKHRWFRFLDAEIVPDNRLVCVASDDPFVLGVLSSRAHAAWSAAAGGFLEDRPIYAKTACFDGFPFPEPNASQRIAIATLAEAFDDARSQLLAQWPELTMTRLYNALGEIAAGGERARPLGQQAGIERIRRLQSEIDDLVTAVYGWPQDIANEDMVARLVVLNGLRSDAERVGMASGKGAGARLPARGEAGQVRAGNLTSPRQAAA